MQSLQFQQLDNVNIESAITVQVDQSILLSNFSTIIDFLKKLGENQVNLQNQVNDLGATQEKFSSQLEVQKEDVKATKGKVLTLNDKVQNQETQINKNKDSIQNNREDINKLLNGFDPSKFSNTGSDNCNFSFSQIIKAEQLLNQLADLKSQFVTKPEFQDKCQKYDNEIADLWDQINGLKQKIGNKDLAQEINILKDELTRKANITFVEQEINNLKQIIASLGGEGIDKNALLQKMDSQDQLSSLYNQFKDLSDMVDQLRKDVDELLDHQNVFIENHIDLQHDPNNLSQPSKSHVQRPVIKKQIGSGNTNSQNNDGGRNSQNSQYSGNGSQNNQNNQNNEADQKHGSGQQQIRKNSIHSKKNSISGNENIGSGNQSNNQSRPQSKLNQLREVIEIVSKQNSRRNSKLKVDQNRELIDQLRLQIQNMQQEMARLGQKKPPAKTEKQEPVIVQQILNNNNSDNSDNNYQALAEQNQSLQNQLSDLLNRFEDLENMLKDYATHGDLDQLRQEIANMTDNLNETQAQSKENAIKIVHLQKLLEGMKNQSHLASTHNPDSTILNMTNDKSQEDEQNAKIKNLKDYLIQLMKALKDDIDKKSTLDDIQKSEAYNMSKLDEVAGALMNKLADKGDTKKALQHLEKKINQIYLILAREGGTEEDALVVKRPLLWSCISCDKSLDKYQGKLGDYKAWAMMPPKETSPERIGKFGRGWKQHIDNKTKITTERMMATDYSHVSQEPQTLPKIRQRGKSFTGVEEEQSQ